MDISMCQVNVGNFFIFFLNPQMPLPSTLYLFLSSLNKHSLKATSHFTKVYYFFYFFHEFKF